VVVSSKTTSSSRSTSSTSSTGASTSSGLPTQTSSGAGAGQTNAAAIESPRVELLFALSVGGIAMMVL
jgi:hypothetical protein